VRDNRGAPIGARINDRGSLSTKSALFPHGKICNSHLNFFRSRLHSYQRRRNPLEGESDKALSPDRLGDRTIRETEPTELLQRRDRGRVRETRAQVRRSRNEAAVARLRFGSRTRPSKNRKRGRRLARESALSHLRRFPSRSGNRNPWQLTGTPKSSITGRSKIKTVQVSRRTGFSHQWGRHGFDGIACDKEACRGVSTRNRSQNDNCRSSTGIRSLIN